MTDQVTNPNGAPAVDPAAAVPSDATTVISHQMRVREYPKMIYPKNPETGEPDWERGVTVQSELAEKEQLSNWDNPKNKSAHAQKAAELLKQEETRRIKADADALADMAKNDGHGATEPTDGAARTAAANAAAQEVAATAGAALPNAPQVDPANVANTAQISEGTAAGQQQRRDAQGGGAGKPK